MLPGAHWQTSQRGNIPPALAAACEVRPLSPQHPRASSSAVLRRQPSLRLSAETPEFFRRSRELTRYACAHGVFEQRQKRRAKITPEPCKRRCPVRELREQRRQCRRIGQLWQRGVCRSSGGRPVGGHSRNIEGMHALAPCVDCTTPTRPGHPACVFLPSHSPAQR